MINKHEKFVEELKHCFYKDIMSDTRLMNNGQKRDKEDIEAKLFSSISLDDLFGDGE